MLELILQGRSLPNEPHFIVMFLEYCLLEEEKTSFGSAQERAWNTLVDVLKSGVSLGFMREAILEAWMQEADPDVDDILVLAMGAIDDYWSCKEMKYDGQ